MLKQWFLAVMVCCASVLHAQNGKNLLDLNQLIEEALENNPAIKAAQHKWRAATNVPGQVAALPDPLLNYTRFLESVETRVGPQQNVFALSQRIPFPGKLSLQGKIAHRDAMNAEENYEAVRRDVVYEIKSVYFDLYAIDRSLARLHEYVALLQDFTRVAETKYATGQGMQANVLKLQVEMSSTIEKTLGFEKMRTGAAARLNALLGRPRDTAVAGVSELDSSRGVFDEAALVEQALASRQELMQLELMIEKSELKKRLAGKTYLPDFNLQASYIDVSKGVSVAPDAGKDAWSLMLGLNLPIWFGKNRSAVREADELLVSSRESYENLENKIRAEITEQVMKVRLTGKTLDLYEQGMLTQAESSLESAKASYRTGKLDFLSLLDAYRMLLTLNLSYAQERADYHKELALLERTVGGTLP